VTDNVRAAGPGETPGLVREQVVIRDNRKIDPSGRPRNQETGRSGTESTDIGGSQDTAEESIEQPEAEVTMGQTGKSTQSGATVGDESVPVESEEIPEEIMTGEVITGDVAPAGFAAELESLRSELDERLRDLQRVTAEYANYRKRVDRDRSAVVEQAIGMVVTALLPTLDDLDRAREHDDLVGPSAAMAEQLGVALAKFGLTAFGEPGDAFDPTRHEAVAHQTSPDVSEPTCVSVMRRGYLLGDRLLRAALVGVADPE
jgi:molecular chaperone GrpE